MRTLREIIPMIDSKIDIILRHRTYDLEELTKKLGEDLAKGIKNSKCGLIEIKKDGDRLRYGITAAFGEGISCYISNEDEWFMTSIIKHIDWKNNKFVTLNSLYDFKFQEIDFDRLVADLQILMNDENKSEETE